MNSTNPAVQRLMDEVAHIDPKDPQLETKLQRLAERLASEQRQTGAATVNDEALIDPADAFACEGCQ
jgi:hypothetical protein